MELKLLGVEELSGQDVLLPSQIEVLAGQLGEDLRKKVATYLRGGAILTPVMSYSSDVIGHQFEVAGGSGVATDGYYYWRVDLAEYVATYGLGIDRDALDRMKSLNWKCPQVPEEEQLRLAKAVMDAQGWKPVTSVYLPRNPA